MIERVKTHYENSNMDCHRVDLEFLWDFRSCLLVWKFLGFYLKNNVLFIVKCGYLFIRDCDVRVFEDEY